MGYFIVGFIAGGVTVIVMSVMFVAGRSDETAEKMHEYDCK